MLTGIGRTTRCAIYTRKSMGQIEHSEFNSLEAQRAICSAYIKSQAPRGWSESPKSYDDMGQTGSNLSRAALQTLLVDVESGLIDVIVVYKIDRITRTLLDFVRLTDLFSQYGVSFVSVTQNFDTSDSTGRLIQNILLTFAQFEREISSDRLRDKFHAMKQRGLFIGGHPPFGFDLVNKRLVPNSIEAEAVRRTFDLYLKLKGMNKVARILAEEGVKRRTRTSKRGNVVEGRGIAFSSVFTMLQNPIYVGDVRYKGQIYGGAHDAIVSRETWDEVQALRAKRTRAKVVDKYPLDLLRGLMFDNHGRSVGVFRDTRHATKRRYYLSNQSEWGRRNGVRRFRMRADDIDQLVKGSVSATLISHKRLHPVIIDAGAHASFSQLIASGGAAAKRFDALGPQQAQSVIRAIIERIIVSEHSLQLILRPHEIVRFLEWEGIGLFRLESTISSKSRPTRLVEIALSSAVIKRDMSKVLEQCARTAHGSPKKSLVNLIRRARMAQQLLDTRFDGGITELAKRIKCTNARLPRLLRLNYLAPDIIVSILDGAQPPELTASLLMSSELPMDWDLQRRILGFPNRPDSIQAVPGW